MLHEFISMHRSEILDLCLRELQSKYPDRHEHDLINDISVFVDEVIQALRTDAGGSSDTVSRGTMAVSHGVLRKKQGFDLSGLVNDFGVVCEAISATAVRYGE